MTVMNAILDRNKREKVIAELTCCHLMLMANAIGIDLSRNEAIAFLNEDGHAHEMWRRMMKAGQEYVLSTLQDANPKPKNHAWALAHRTVAPPA